MHRRRCQASGRCQKAQTATDPLPYVFPAHPPPCVFRTPHPLNYGRLGAIARHIVRMHSLFITTVQSDSCALALVHQPSSSHTRVQIENSSLPLLELAIHRALIISHQLLPCSITGPSTYFRLLEPRRVHLMIHRHLQQSHQKLVLPYRGRIKLPDIRTYRPSPPVIWLHLAGTPEAKSSPCHTTLILLGPIQLPSGPGGTKSLCGGAARIWVASRGRRERRKTGLRIVNAFSFVVCWQCGRCPYSVFCIVVISIGDNDTLLPAEA